MCRVLNCDPLSLQLLHLSKAEMLSDTEFKLFGLKRVPENELYQGADCVRVPGGFIFINLPYFSYSIGFFLFSFSQFEAI